MPSSSALVWSLHELGLADFNDKRLTKRGVRIATDFLDHPRCSIPQATQDWASTKGTYRFFSNDKVQSGKMLKSHHVQLVERASACDTILVAQDTTTLNLSSKQVAGVGNIGDGGDDGELRGLYVHSGLAMNTAGLPLGITSQKIYARKAETKTAAYRKTAKSRPISEKETYRWVEAVVETQAVLPNKHIVMVGDRESDIYEVFQTGRKLGVDLLVRTKQNRLLTESGQAVRLFDRALRGDIVTTYETDIPIDNHRTRKAMLTIRTTTISLPQPKNKNKGSEQAIPLTVLNVMEENPSAGFLPIHWMLTTSLGVATPAEAMEKVQWYIYRWRIERFHYVLKTGAFNIEKLQFETLERFRKAITMYSLVAYRILHAVYYERSHPDEDANAVFSAHEIQLLRLREQHHTGALTIHTAVIATAKLGGYLARKSDGPPGIKALWSGLQALQYLVEGMLLGSQMTAHGLQTS